MNVFGYILFLIAAFNTFLLAFAYRDLSLSLMGMAALSIIGLPLATYLILNKKLLHWFVSEDENGNRIQAYVEELDNDGLAKGFFQNCK